MNLFEQLKAPFPVNRVSWRVGSVKKDKTKAMLLAYIDARDVMQRLDEVVGPAMWQNRYPFEGCWDIGIEIDGEWVWRANGADKTKVEAIKGQYSDAFKRAAVMWGIGRYLYKLKSPWVAIDQYKKFDRANIPALPEWATPEGYEKIINQRKEKDA